MSSHRHRLVQLVSLLHEDLNLEHGDIRESNVFDRDGMPMLIDFELTKEHKCMRKMEILFFAIVPKRKEYGCDEMYDLMKNIGAWNPGKYGDQLLDIMPKTYQRGYLVRVELCTHKRDKRTGGPSEEVALAWL